MGQASPIPQTTLTPSGPHDGKPGTDSLITEALSVIRKPPTPGLLCQIEARLGSIS